MVYVLENNYLVDKSHVLISKPWLRIGYPFMLHPILEIGPIFLSKGKHYFCVDYIVV
jgi:hypothetical protein